MIKKMHIICFLAGVSLAPLSAHAAAVHASMGYDNRGVSGLAGSVSAGAYLETVPVTLKTELALDLLSVQRRRMKYMDFRSILLEAGTGTFLPGPVDFSMRVQFERFSRSNASLFSVLPMVSFDTHFFFLSMGCNFRTFSVDEGNLFAPYFSTAERQFTFAIGGRCWPRKNLSVSLSMRNYDDYSTGNFASIGYESKFSLALKPCTVEAIIDYRPAGTIALASTPSGFAFRVCARKPL